MFLPYFAKVNGKRIGFLEWYEIISTIHEYISIHVNAGADEKTILRRIQEKFGDNFDEKLLEKFIKAYK